MDLKRQTACKPGSVPPSHKAPAEMAIPLGRPLRSASRDLPGRQPGNRQRRPYLVLLPVGLAVPPPLPETRCALTAPFHPYPDPKIRRRYVFCGAFPGVAPAGHYPAPCFRGARTFLPATKSAPPVFRWIASRADLVAGRPSGHLTPLEFVTLGRVPQGAQTPVISQFGKSPLCARKGHAAAGVRCLVSDRRADIGQRQPA